MTNKEKEEIELILGCVFLQIKDGPLETAWDVYDEFEKQFKTFIDIFEVKKVDLKKELDSFAYSLPHSAIGDGCPLGHFDDPRVIEARDGGWTHSWKYKEIEKIAKHFFELGLQVKKEE